MSAPLRSPAAALLDAARRAQAAGDPAAAVRALAQACEAAPGHPVPLNALGLALTAAGRAGEAVAPFERAIAADPGAPALRLNLADARAAAGDAAGALAALEEALARDPYMLPALLRRAQLLERAGDAEGALRAWRGLLASLPADGAPPAYAAPVAHGRALFPWLDGLEAAFPAIREELLALWAADAPGFDPYVAFAPGQPVNQ